MIFETVHDIMMNKEITRPMRVWLVFLDKVFDVVLVVMLTRGVSVLGVVDSTC